MAELASEMIMSNEVYSARDAFDELQLDNMADGLAIAKKVEKLEREDQLAIL